MGGFCFCSCVAVSYFLPCLRGPGASSSAVVRARRGDKESREKEVRTNLERLLPWHGVDMVSYGVAHRLEQQISQRAALPINVK